MKKQTLDHGTRKLIRQKMIPNHLPILILDEVWLSQFPEGYRNGKIRSLEEKIRALLKENVAVRDQIRSLNRRKKESLHSILDLTPDIHNGKGLENEDRNREYAESLQRLKDVAVKETEQLRRDIEQINAELPAWQSRENQIPGEIQKINEALWEETVEICCVQMREEAERLKNVRERAASLRAAYETALEEQETLKNNLEQTYRLLHNLIGPDFMEQLDKLDLYTEKRKRRKRK